jgi:uncharacterized protein (TIGR00251 family)
MRVAVHVKPGSKKGSVVQERTEGGAQIDVFLSKRAVDGEANKQLVEVLAKHYGVRKTAVEILHGFKSRDKVVEVDIT